MKLNKILLLTTALSFIGTSHILASNCPKEILDAAKVLGMSESDAQLAWECWEKKWQWGWTWNDKGREQAFQRFINALVKGVIESKSKAAQIIMDTAAKIDPSQRAYVKNPNA